MARKDMKLHENKISSYLIVTIIMSARKRGRYELNLSRYTIIQLFLISTNISFRIQRIYPKRNWKSVVTFSIEY